MKTSIFRAIIEDNARNSFCIGGSGWISLLAWKAKKSSFSDPLPFFVFLLIFHARRNRRDRYEKGRWWKRHIWFGIDDILMLGGFFYNRDDAILWLPYHLHVDIWQCTLRCRHIERYMMRYSREEKHAAAMLTNTPCQRYHSFERQPCCRQNISPLPWYVVCCLCVSARKPEENASSSRLLWKPWKYFLLWTIRCENSQVEEKNRHVCCPELDVSCLKASHF